jgi:hypothetical protein
VSEETDGIICERRRSLTKAARHFRVNTTFFNAVPLLEALILGGTERSCSFFLYIFSSSTFGHFHNNLTTQQHAEKIFFSYDPGNNAAPLCWNKIGYKKRRWEISKKMLSSHAYCHIIYFLFVCCGFNPTEHTLLDVFSHDLCVAMRFYLLNCISQGRLHILLRKCNSLML